MAGEIVLVNGGINDLQYGYGARSIEMVAPVTDPSHYTRVARSLIETVETHVTSRGAQAFVYNVPFGLTRGAATRATITASMSTDATREEREAHLRSFDAQVEHYNSVLGTACEQLAGCSINIDYFGFMQDAAAQPGAYGFVGSQDVGTCPGVTGTNLLSAGGLKDCTAAEAIARGCTLATSPSSDGGCGPVYSRYLYADTATHLTSFAANAVDTNKTIPAMSRAGIML